MQMKSIICHKITEIVLKKFVVISDIKEGKDVYYIHPLLLLNDRVRERPTKHSNNPNVLLENVNPIVKTQSMFPRFE